MNVTDNYSAPSADAGHEEHHPTARERQRRGPMFGCLRAFMRIGGALAIFAAVIGIGLFWYLGTTSFADLVRLRIQATLESRLGRKVSIRDVDRLVLGDPGHLGRRHLRGNCHKPGRSRSDPGLRSV